MESGRDENDLSGLFGSVVAPSWGISFGYGECKSVQLHATEFTCTDQICVSQALGKYPSLPNIFGSSIT